MNILALDCATKTGWAALIDGRIESGVQDFSKKRGESNGMMFLRFSGWLRSMENCAYQVIAYEQAHHRGGAAVDICVNLTGRAQEFAVYIGAECMAVHTSKVKKFATGRGNAGKPEIMGWFKGFMNREPIDDNEADAMALLKFVMADLGVTI